MKEKGTNIEGWRGFVHVADHAVIPFVESDLAKHGADALQAYLTIARYVVCRSAAF
jgi:hypothetical protein